MNSMMGSFACLLLVAVSLAAPSIVLEVNAFSSSPLAVPTAFHPPLSPRSSSSRNTNRPPCALFASSESENNASEEENDDKEDDTESEAKNEQEEAADRWKQQAKELREQIQKMEAEMPDKPVDPERAAALKAAQEAAAKAAASMASSRRPAKGEPVSLLDGKNILMVGSNGRLGSMVCRRLLRQYPEIANVVAMVHVVGENSETSRGFGRLAYEVGAEDGRGSIGPAWSAEDRTATFEFDEEYMTPYHLEKLRIVECEVRNDFSAVSYDSIVEQVGVESVGFEDPYIFFLIRLLGTTENPMNIISFAHFLFSSGFQYLSVFWNNE